LLIIYGFSKYKLKLNLRVFHNLWFIAISTTTIAISSETWNQNIHYMKLIKYHRPRCVHSKPEYVFISAVYFELCDWVALNANEETPGGTLWKLQVKFLAVHLTFSDCCVNNINNNNNNNNWLTASVV
jgi:hypothetical protein